MAKNTKTILVVEDEMPLVRAIRAKLEQAGFEVVTARTVKQAISSLMDIDHIDVVWLDHYLLGKEDGLDFIVKIKDKSMKHKDVPVFVISNTASAEKIKSYLRLGAVKYYVKAEKRLDGIIADIKSYLGEQKP